MTTANSSTVDADKPAVPAVGSRDKTVPWYKPTLEPEHLPEPTRQLLKTYSRIPEKEIVAHVQKVRDEAWEIWPFPCIGQFRFLNLALPSTPSFRSIVTRLGAPSVKFLDLGCCFGQDLRALAAEGVPGENLIGVDLYGEYHKLGHKLFCDGAEMVTRDSGATRALGATLIAADLFDLLIEDETRGAEVAESTAVALQPLLASIDVLQASAFLHLFTREKQLDAGAAIVKLMKGPGALIIGTQVGSRTPGLQEQGNMYLHNVASFEDLWAEIGQRTASEWEVKAVLVEDPRKPWGDTDVGKLNFEITRVR